MKAKILSYTGEVLFSTEVDSRFKVMNLIKKALENDVNEEDIDILSTIEYLNKQLKLNIQSYLLVDDNESLLRVNSKLISKKGHYVKTFTNPEEANEYFSEDPDFFDIIILDNHMPEMSGNELASIMCEQTTKSKVYMLTGFGDDVDVYHEHNVFVMHKGKENLLDIVPSNKLGTNQDDNSQMAA